jgi:hypothetical protein
MDTYQDELRADGIVRGERDCDERWTVLAPHLPDAGMLLDVGSNLGYFGLRAAIERPRLAVVSLEADPRIAARQRAIVAGHADLRRVMVLGGSLNANGAADWADTPDWFDAVLLLAIIHWFDDPAAVVRALSSMSGRLICEVPDAGDAGACGREKLELWKDPEAWFADVTGRHVRHLGRVTRHTSTEPSHMILVDGPVSRSPRRPYRGGPERELGRYRVDHDGSLTMLSVGGSVIERVPGVNLVNLMRAGALLHPSIDDVMTDATRALDRHPSHPDPFPHNMLWGPDGIRMIDFGPCDALLTTRDSLQTLRTHLPRWRDGKTVDDDAAIRHLALVNRLRASRTGQRLLGVVPPTLKRRVRRALFGR